MKIDKEYPATHSMSTSWYCVDDNGNVAIIDFNENGPVPWCTPEESIESLSYGYCEDEDTVRSLYESILTFAKESSKREEFVDDWIMSAYTIMNMDSSTMMTQE